MADPRMREVRNLTSTANASTSRHIRIGLPVKVLVPLAASLLLVGCAKGIKQNEGVNAMGNGSGQAQIVADTLKYQAPSDTLKTTPKLVAPDVKTLEHYAPFCPPYNADSVYVKGVNKKEFMLAWFGMEDTWKPFGLRQEILDSYSQNDRAELMRRWERAKTEIRVAFLSDRGATPATARIIHTPEEIDKMEAQWQRRKDDDKEHQKVHNWKWDTQRPSQR
ncbi:Uncharacterised protein [Candidatus Anstonella stagnisolia]|nr:Uncharacterised protein [Candidatus Anstonella stagnisolia]